MESSVASLLPRTGLESLTEPWKAIAVGFLVEKARRTGSSRTTEVYSRTVGRFLEEVGDPAMATPFDVHRFAYGLGPRHITPSESTISVRLAAVSGFFDFALRMELIGKNPASNVRRPMARPPLPRGLTTAEVARLFDVIPETPAGRLDRAIIVTALLTGRRRSELMDLRIVDPEGGEPACYVVRTKGGGVRRRELPEPAFKAIRATERALGAPSIPGDTRVFAISDATFYTHLRRYGEAAGLGCISPHTLRHTAAKLRRRAGATIEAVSLLLGHQSIATTAVYLRQLEEERDGGWQAVAQSLGLTEVGSRRHVSAAAHDLHGERLAGDGSLHTTGRLRKQPSCDLDRRRTCTSTRRRCYPGRRPGNPATCRRQTVLARPSDSSAMGPFPGRSVPIAPASCSFRRSARDGRFAALAMSGTAWPCNSGRSSAKSFTSCS